MIIADVIAAKVLAKGINCLATLSSTTSRQLARGWATEWTWTMPDGGMIPFDHTMPKP